MCDTNYFLKNSDKEESQIKKTKIIKKKFKEVE